MVVKVVAIVNVILDKEGNDGCMSIGRLFFSQISHQQRID